MKNLRNMLCDGVDVFGGISELDRVEDERAAMKFFDAIPHYGDGDRPSENDVVVAEKVLKYAAQCNYIGFTKDDALLTMRYSTNVLRWSLEI